MQPAFYQYIQSISERTSKEITPDDIVKAFQAAYYLTDEHEARFALVDYSFAGEGSNKKIFKGTVKDNGSEKQISGEGNGPVSSLLNALKNELGTANLEVREYSEHSLGQGSDVKAASYVQLVDNATGKSVWGVGVDEDVTAASLKAVLSAASNASVDGQRRLHEVEDFVVGNRV